MKILRQHFKNFGKLEEKSWEGVGHYPSAAQFAARRFFWKDDRFIKIGDYKGLILRHFTTDNHERTSTII